MLQTKLLFLKQANLSQPDKAASAFKRMGLKIGSREKWTPRLIIVEKQLRFD
jgi:hypothetical protein